MKKIIIVSFLMLSSVALADTTFITSNFSKFKNMPVKVYASDQSCSNAGLTSDEILDLANEAINRYWNTVPNSSLQMEVGGVKTVSSNFKTQPICQTSTGACTPNSSLIVDNGIVITCNTDTSINFTSSAILALTVPNNISGDEIKGAIIAINDAFSPWKNKSRSEKIAIIAHEIGHALGLGHSDRQDALMNFQSYSTRVALGWDDLWGITYLYPASQPVSCGTIKDVGQSNTTSLLIGLFFVILIACLRKTGIKLTLKTRS